MIRFLIHRYRTYRNHQRQRGGLFPTPSYQEHRAFASEEDLMSDEAFIVDGVDVSFLDPKTLPGQPPHLPHAQTPPTPGMESVSNRGMESIGSRPENASLSAMHDLTERGLDALEPVPEKASPPTAPAPSSTDGMGSVDPLQEKANETCSTRTGPSVSGKEGVNSPHPLLDKASTPTLTVASEDKGVVSVDPLQEKAFEGLEGKEVVISPWDAGICHLLAGYFKYYAEEFNHSTEVG